MNFYPHFFLSWIRTKTKNKITNKQKTLVLMLNREIISIFFKIFFKNVHHFQSLYWIFHNIASIYVLIFCVQGIWDPSSLTRNQTFTPCIGRWNLNHLFMWSYGRFCSQEKRMENNTFGGNICTKSSTPPALQVF